MKFNFSCQTIIEASSEEDALQQIGNHVSGVARQIGSGRSLSDCGALFTVSQAADSATVVPIVDTATEAHGPIDLTLDPDSNAGIALAAQKKQEAADAEAAAQRLANASKTDAEVLAEHSAAEQATLNAPAS